MVRTASAAVTIAVLGLAMLVAAGCLLGSDDEDEQAGQPPDSTAGAATNPCPDGDASVCAFAAEMERLLLAGDGNSLADRAHEREYSCPPQPRAGSDPIAALCTGRAAGEKVRGYDTGRTYSEGTVLSRADYARFLTPLARNAVADASDDYGPGALRLYSIGAGGGAPGCPDCRMLVFSRLVSSPPERLLREGVLLAIEKRDGKWGIRLALTGLQIGQDIPLKLRGGVHEGTTYKPWHPSGQAPSSGGPIWLGAGAAVKGAGDCLNLRERPSREAAVIDCLRDGSALQVVGGPAAAEGIRWWRVVRPAPLFGQGWVSAEFIAVP